MLVGWAKPTPVITRNFRKIVRDENLVTLAGPVSNLILVVVAFLVLAVICLAVPGGRMLVLASMGGMLSLGVPSGLQAVVLLAHLAILINLSLFFFNLCPFLRWTAAISCATCCLTTRCASTTASAAGSAGC